MEKNLDIVNQFPQSLGTSLNQGSFVSMSRRRGGGVRAKVQHLNFLAIFLSNSRPLGPESSSNLIEVENKSRKKQSPRVVDCSPVAEKVLRRIAFIIN